MLLNLVPRRAKFPRRINENVSALCLHSNFTKSDAFGCSVFAISYQTLGRTKVPLISERNKHVLRCSGTLSFVFVWFKENHSIFSCSDAFNLFHQGDVTRLIFLSSFSFIFVSFATYDHAE